MHDDNVKSQSALNFAKKCLSIGHNPIEDLKQKIAESSKSYLKVLWEEALESTLKVVDGTDIKTHRQLITWCESRNIDYEKFGIKAL